MENQIKDGINLTVWSNSIPNSNQNGRNRTELPGAQQTPGTDP